MSPHARNADTAADTDLSPAAAHNISINVTDTDSPTGARRRIHLRSLSDVTPASRAHTPRARSHSERPRAGAASLAPSPARTPPQPPTPRQARSERSSPDSSPRPLDDSHATRVRAHALGVLGDPWRKMSDVDLTATGRPLAPSDPWVRNRPVRAEEAASSTTTSGASGAAGPGSGGEPERRREVRRGKLERRSPVACESCGGQSCECWRARSPGRRLQRGGASLGAQCTCESRSARPSPARLAPRAPPPPRALSDDEERPRRLYKSTSQRMICSTGDGERSRKTTADPLLETTC